MTLAFVCFVHCGPLWYQGDAQIIHAEFEQWKDDGLWYYTDLGSELSSCPLPLVTINSTHYAIKGLFLFSGIVYYEGLW